MRVRFAPSPTGYLHLGNARTALFNWLFVRANNGKFILRIEDTDIARSKDIYFKSIVEDLKWLGLNWDEGPDIGGPFAPYRQSERIELYREYAQKLIKKNKAYPCFCSDSELKERRQQALKKGLAPKYDNRCRSLTPSQIDNFKKKGLKPALRFKVPDKKLIVRDLIRGEVIFDTSLMGDFVIMKSTNTPSFNFAVVCDDYSMQISHVIRGEDHLPNTPKHILLFEALNATPPEFAHMSLTTAPGGQRLSKRAGAVSVANYRELGYLPETMVNYLALLGWAPKGDKEIVSCDQMIKEFRIEKVSKSSEAFDPAKLDWMSGMYIRSADIGRLTKLVIPYLIDKKFIKKECADKKFDEVKKIVTAIRDHLNHLSEITDHAKVFFVDIDIKDKEVKNLLATAEAKSVLNSSLENVEKLDSLSDENFSSLIKSIQRDTSLKGKKIYQPLRAAITGKLHGPELKLIMPILGKEKCITRLKKALS